MTIVVQITGESAHDVLKQMVGLVLVAGPISLAPRMTHMDEAVAALRALTTADKPEVINPSPLAPTPASTVAEAGGYVNTQTSSASVPQTDRLQVIETAVAKTIRTRKKAEPASTEPTELDKQEAAVPLPAPKIEDVRAAMKALAQSKMPDMNAGTTLVEAVLRQFGVMKASDVPDAERANFIAECAKKAAA